MSLGVVAIVAYLNLIVTVVVVPMTTDTAMTTGYLL